MDDDEARINFEVDGEDEFGGDYQDPSALQPNDVRGTVVYTVDWSVSTVVDQIDADPDDPESVGVLVTDPPFQRRTAWTAERQSLFVESLMLGLPIPPLVLAESQQNEGQFYVLDGKQRLTALKRFFAANDGLRLTGLELLKPLLEGKVYREVAETRELRPYTRTMLAQPIRTIVVRNWRTPALLHLIFSRLNRASVPLASHELRQALYPGKFTNYVNEASASSSQLLRARRLEQPDFRLRDAETLLRYIAFRTNIKSYRGDLRDFLDRVLRSGNANFSEFAEPARGLVSDMEGAIEATFDIFGTSAFLRFDADRRKYMPRFNVAVFDIMTWYFASREVAAKSVARANDVREAFEMLCASDSTFAGYLTSTTKTPAATIGRIRMWGESLGRVIGEDLSLERSTVDSLPLVPQR